MPFRSDGGSRPSTRVLAIAATAVVVLAGCRSDADEPEPLAPTEDGAAAPEREPVTPDAPGGEAEPAERPDPPAPADDPSSSDGEAAEGGGAPSGEAPNGDGAGATAPAEERPDEVPGGPVREPEPFEEDTALGQSFGEEDPFAEGQDYDCITEDDLVNVEENLGADARVEVEGLIDAGELEAC